MSDGIADIVEKASNAIVEADCATSKRFTSDDQVRAVLACLSDADLVRLLDARAES